MELIEVDNVSPAKTKSFKLPSCNRFVDFEKFLFQLPDVALRKRLFADFLKGLVLSEPLYQAENIYFRQEMSDESLKNLKLSRSNPEWDGVIYTNTEETHVFKIFLEPDRKELTREIINGFLEQPFECDYKLIITNSDELPKKIKNAKNSYSIRGADFDQLPAEQLNQLLQFHNKELLRLPIAQPRAHQLTALKEVQKGFRSHDRLTSVMACGSGKTLLSLWLLETMKVKNVIVFLPSLGLLSQTLHEWLKNTSIKDFRYLCVCSDSSVAKMSDELHYQQTELDFVVTTDPEHITQYFRTQSKNPKAVHIIFSTYQSAAMVAAGMRSQDQFDLGIFDEAHKTAGDVDKSFSFALLNKNIKIKKRLFLTATPRVIRYKDSAYQANIKNRYSMDNESIYGPQVFTFNFGDAVKEKIITDCKIIISVVTSNMVENVIHKSPLKLKGSNVDTLMLAHAIALEHAARSNGIKRIITFHSRVDAASDFSEINKDHPYGLLNDFDLYHVNGDMSAASRAKMLLKFSESQCAILTNARCLTEGIDVPTVDMVAFLSPKKSCIDIVQAAGRAMRQAKGKKCGYVLIPVYIPMKTSLPTESLINSSDFGDIWRVLKALAEHDTLLYDEISLGQQWRGESDSYTGDRIQSNKIQIISPSDFDISELRGSIKTLCLEQVGSNWDFMYGQLIRFKKEHGHANVATNDEKWKKLGSWVQNNRQDYKKHFLSEDRIKKLESLGFIWDVKEAEWAEQYGKLEQYFQEHGHGNVPIRDKIFDDLGKWLANNRRVYSQNNISLERIKKLEAVGVDWNPLEAQWEQHYDMLRKHYQLYKHINISLRSQKWGKLGQWLSGNRSDYKKNKLPVDRIKKLEALGIIWDPKDTQWLEQYEMLKTYYIKHGHGNVAATNKAWGNLGSWLSNNRRSYRENKLSADRIKKLEALGVIWDPKDAQWPEKYEMLKKYYKKHGHCNVATTDKDWSGLGHWLCANRTHYRQNKLSQERIKKLEALNMVV